MLAVNPVSETLWLVCVVVVSVELDPRLAVVPYSTLEVAASFVVHVTVAAVSDVALALTLVMVGAVASAVVPAAMVLAAVVAADDTLELLASESDVESVSAASTAAFTLASDEDASICASVSFVFLS